MPLPPSLILSTVLAVLWAALWFAWRGRTARDWAIATLAALLGFGAGQLAGSLLGLPLPTIGQVRVIEGTLFCWLALLLIDRTRRRS